MQRAIEIDRFQDRKAFFELDPFFSQPRLPFGDMKFFGNQQGTFKRTNYFVFHKYINPLIENEVRAFIQYLTVELKYMKSTLIAYNYLFEAPFSKFINQYDPECSSILDYEYNDIVDPYTDYLLSIGLHAWHSKMHYVTKKDMEWYEGKKLDPPKRCVCCRRARSRKERYAETHSEETE